MTATKITTKIINLTDNDTTTKSDIYVPTSNNFYFTQPTDDKVMIGVVRKRINFGRGERWDYENIDCLSNQTFSNIQATSTEKLSLPGSWKTYYFQDTPSGSPIIGNAIVVELKNQETTRQSGAVQEESKPVAVYFDFNGQKKGSILCPSGTVKSNVVVRYDSVTDRINLVILGVSGFTYHSFAIGETSAGRHLTFADAVYSDEYKLPVIQETAISPDGNMLLCYQETTESEMDEPYCTIIVVGEKPAKRFEGLTSHRFMTFDKMFGNNVITWHPEQIQVKCFAGNLEFNLTTGGSKFIEFGVQNVNLVFTRWKTSGYAPYDTCKPAKIPGLSWRVPSSKRPKPLRTFVFEEEIVEHNYDFTWTKLNKSIPDSNHGLEWIMLFENDNVAIFKIGCRTIICFDKLLQFQPVIYQIPKTDGLEIAAVSRDRIYVQTYTDEDEEYGGNATITIKTYQYNFVNRIESLLRFYSVSEMFPPGAVSTIAKFLAHQKKD